MQSKRKISFGLLVALTLGPYAMSAQTTSDKKIEGFPTTFAIAQFIDGRFLLVGLDGRVRQFDLRPKDFFTLARFSPDGKLIAGLTERTITVLNQRFELVWQRTIDSRNITGIALSPDGTKVAFLENDVRSRSARVEVVMAEGSRKIVDTVAFKEPAAQARGVSWDAKGERIAFGIGGEIRIVEANGGKKVSDAAGYDPSWSPDGRWIAYRSIDGQLTLLDVETHTHRAMGLRLGSGVHWSPDSNYIFINEDYSSISSSAGCMANSRFVVYRLSDKARTVVYDPCGVRDANFGWISGAPEWSRAAVKASTTGR